MNQPQLYSEVNDSHIKHKSPVLENFIKLIKWHSDSDTVLDVGVGDGKLAIECLIPRLPGGFGKFVASDISESMLAFAKEKYKLPNVEFKQLDIATDMVPPEFLSGFDHIFSIYTLHWVRNQRKAFLNMHKMLKPGGDMLLIYSVNNPADPLHIKLSKRSNWKHYDHLRLTSPFSESKEPKKELEEILAQTGFRNISCHIQKTCNMFTTLENLQNLFISLNPYVSGMSLEDRCNYISDMIEDMKSEKVYATNTIEGKQCFQFSYNLFVVYASKAA